MLGIRAGVDLPVVRVLPQGFEHGFHHEIAGGIPGGGRVLVDEGERLPVPSRRDVAEELADLAVGAEHAGEEFVVPLAREAGSLAAGGEDGDVPLRRVARHGRQRVVVAYGSEEHVCRSESDSV